MDEQWTQAPDDGAPEQAPETEARPALDEPGSADAPPTGTGARGEREESGAGAQASDRAPLHPELRRELAAIRELDPDVRDFTDLTRMESFPRFIELAQKGAGFLDAFRAANFDAIVRRQTRAARQAAVNELRSTRHLEPVGGEAEPASDLTQEEMDWWKAFGFSEKKAKYYHNKYKKER